MNLDIFGKDERTLFACSCGRCPHYELSAQYFYTTQRTSNLNNVAYKPGMCVGRPHAECLNLGRSAGVLFAERAPEWPQHDSVFHQRNAAQALDTEERQAFSLT